MRVRTKGTREQVEALAREASRLSGKTVYVYNCNGYFSYRGFALADVSRLDYCYNEGTPGATLIHDVCVGDFKV